MDAVPDILVVDDDDAIRTMMTELLSDAGYRVRAAANGTEALMAICDRAPALLVTDLRMPGMNGIDVLDQVRTIWSSLPIAVITATLQDAAPVRERYGVACIVKPFDLDELLDCVRRLLSRATDELGGAAEDTRSGRPN